MARKTASVRRKAADSAGPRSRARERESEVAPPRRSASHGRASTATAEPDTNALPRPRSRQPRTAAPARLREDFRSYARAAILAAAEEVLAAEGLHATRIEEIARRARVAVGTIYNLVGDREALVVEIMGQRKTEVVTLLANTLKAQRDREFRDQLHAVVLAAFEYFSEHSRFFRLVLETQRSPGKSQAPFATHGTMHDIRKIYRELMQRGIKQGALRKEDADLYPGMLGGMMREVLIFDLEAQPRTAAAQSGLPAMRAAAVVRMFLEGAGVS